MTRPTILDLDLVVVPREAAQVMLDEVTAADQHEPFSDTTMSSIFDSMLSASPYPTAWDDVRKYVAELETRLVAVAGPCSLGVGCEQYGVCYADAHGKPEECGKPSFECEALKDARRIADHDKKSWLAAEALTAELEKRLADAEREPKDEVDEGPHQFVTDWHRPARCQACGGLRDHPLHRAARAYMEGK